MVKENQTMRSQTSRLSMRENVSAQTKPSQSAAATPPNSIADGPIEPAGLYGLAGHGDHALATLIATGKSLGYLTFDQINA